MRFLLFSERYTKLRSHLLTSVTENAATGVVVAALNVSGTTLPDNTIPMERRVSKEHPHLFFYAHYFALFLSHFYVNVNYE